MEESRWVLREADGAAPASSNAELGDALGRGLPFVAILVCSPPVCLPTQKTTLHFNTAAAEVANSLVVCQFPGSVLYAQAAHYFPERRFGPVTADCKNCATFGKYRLSERYLAQLANSFF